VEQTWNKKPFQGNKKTLKPLKLQGFSLVRGTGLELVSAFQDSLLQRAVFQSQHDRVPLPCIAGLFPDKRPFNALIVLSLDRSIVVDDLHASGNSYTS
jgi:hypothetical protein